MWVKGAQLFDILTETPPKSLTDAGHKNEGTGSKGLLHPDVENEAKNLSS
jgi:hypothetical protein